MRKNVLNGSLQNSPLPERRILVNGTVYRIHGLVHGNIWIPLSLPFKGEVNRQLKGCRVLCEDGFVSWIPNAISMREAEYFGFGKMPFLDRIRFLTNFTYNYFFSKKRKDEPEIFDQIRKMSSIEDLIEIRNFLFRNYLEEPQGMNTLMESNDSGTIDSPRGNIPLLVRRYVYEAKVSLNYGNENNLDELHLVVGCAHELPLEYLLNHREILEKYSL